MFSLVINEYDRMMEMILEKALLSVVQINYLAKSVLHYYVNVFLMQTSCTRDKNHCSARHRGQQQVTENTEVI